MNVICTEYETLLIFSQKALESWRNRREEFTRLGLRDKKVADELLRLQADYAKAYSRLMLHEDDCEICGFFSKIRARNYASTADAALDNKWFGLSVHWSSDRSENLPLSPVSDEQC